MKQSHHPINKKFLIIIAVMSIIIGVQFLQSKIATAALLPLLALLACPISMFFMMKGMHHHENQKKDHNKPDVK